LTKERNGRSTCGGGLEGEEGPKGEAGTGSGAGGAC